MGERDELRWFVVLSGIADAWLWGFDADGWRLRHGDPALGTLGILPMRGARLATLDDALWLADALAFDHDAPVGVKPALAGVFPRVVPKDPAAVPPTQPIHHFNGPLTAWYWDSLSGAHSAAAELRFNGSYVIRYGGEDPGPDTDFTRRFDGREELLNMYAMATRQADVLSEYLCLYRILEGADGKNGTTFAADSLPILSRWDFGVLRVIGLDEDYATAANAFAVYKDRAIDELSALSDAGVDDIPTHMYRLRNSLAHGKREVLARGHGERFQQAARTLPIVKLLARMAVEPRATPENGELRTESER